MRIPLNLIDENHVVWTPVELARRLSSLIHSLPDEDIILTNKENEMLIEGIATVTKKIYDNE